MGTPGFERYGQSGKRIKRYAKNVRIIYHITVCKIWVNGYAWGCSESATAGAYRVSPDTVKTGSVGVPLTMADVSVFDTETGSECTYD